MVIDGLGKRKKGNVEDIRKDEADAGGLSAPGPASGCERAETIITRGLICSGIVDGRKK